jgi:hypothetical protein
MELNELLRPSPPTHVEIHPTIFNLGESADRERLSKLAATGLIQHVRTDYLEQLKEHVQVLNPAKVYTPQFEQVFRQHVSQVESEAPLWQHGRWVYYPWLSTLVQVLDEESYQQVRTARNRNLIPQGEQQRFYNSTIGIAGLSVGHSAMLAIVLSGGGRHVRLADHDRLGLSNMNRVPVGCECLGLRKVEMTARLIYQINPYTVVEILPEGLTPDNVDAFLMGPPRLNIVLDEMDNLAMKFLLRQHVRQARLPIVMAADCGDNGVVDIERYDLDPNTPFFQGRMGDVTYEQLRQLDKFGIGRLITKHVGPQNVTERLQQSLMEMGKTIVSWPQLGGAALLNGAAVAYCVRRILNNQPLEPNRAIVSLDEKLIPDYNSAEQVSQRAAIADNFRRIFHLE